jgi:hypothetical protein
MQTSISSHPARRWSVLALIALLGLAMTFATSSASSASSGRAVAAKKCKKGKKSAAAAKKKKCKKKKKAAPVTPVTPAPPPPPPPPVGTLRATLTWSTASDVDLYVFDPSGIGGYEGGGIPNIRFPDDDTDGFGPEQLFDLQTPSNRQFSYCIQQLVDSPGTIATLQFVRADGSSGSLTTTNGQLDNEGDAVELIPSGGHNPIDGEECGFVPEEI